MAVCRDDLAISIDGTLIAQAALTDRHNRPLSRWTGRITLVSDERSLLIAGIADSLDGRHFEQLAANAIVGRAVPGWMCAGAYDA